MALEFLVANLAGPIRYGTLEGRKCLISPCAAGGEGVLEGSHGGYFYPLKVWNHKPKRWDGRPVVVYHPILNGKPSTANDPIIYNRRKVGTVFNTVVDDKLRPELWLDIEKTNEVDDRIIPALERGEKMECSTGIDAIVTKKPGVHNGKKYKGEVIHVDPDHIAILPDQKGAYSIEEGGGINVTNAYREAENHVGIIANEMSFDSLQSKVMAALRAKVGKPGESWYGYIAAMYQTFLIYYTDGKYYKLKYSVSGENVTVTGDPEEVVRYSEWQTTEGKFVGNQSPDTKESDMAQKKEAVDAVITAGFGWEESEREFLTNMAADAFKNVEVAAARSKENQKKREEALKIANTGTQTPPPTPSAPAPTTPAPTPQQLTPDQMVQMIINSNTPAGNYLKSMVQAGEVVMEQLIANIKTNPNNTFSDEQLKAMDLGQLQAIARLAGTPLVAVGNAGSPAFNPQALFLGNAGGAPTAPPSKETPLVVKKPEFQRLGRDRGARTVASN